MKLTHSFVVGCSLMLLGSWLERPSVRSPDRGDHLVPVVQKTGKLELSGTEFVVDNYTEVEVDGDVGSFTALPPRAEIVHVVVDGKRVVKVVFETKKEK